MIHWHKYKFSRIVQRGLLLEYRYTCTKCGKLKTRFLDRWKHNSF